MSIKPYTNHNYKPSNIINNTQKLANFITAELTHINFSDYTAVPSNCAVTRLFCQTALSNLMLPNFSDFVSTTCY